MRRSLAQGATILGALVTMYNWPARLLFMKCTVHGTPYMCTQYKPLLCKLLLSTCPFARESTQLPSVKDLLQNCVAINLSSIMCRVHTYYKLYIYIIIYTVCNIIMFILECCTVKCNFPKLYIWDTFSVCHYYCNQCW